MPLEGREAFGEVVAAEGSDEEEGDKNATRLA